MKLLVVGLGRIGLVAACCLAKSGHSVTGIEINPEKLELIRAGGSPFYEPEIVELLKSLAATGRLQFSQTLPDCITAEAVIIAVNTPSLPDGSADLSQVQCAVSEASSRMGGPGTLIMKSTVPPGTGNAMVSRFFKGKPLNYVSNPEFLRTGQSLQDWYTSSRIVIGCDNKAAVQTMQRLYHDMEAPWLITDISSAEMIKYASNSFLATKVSFINEVANLCERVDADIDDVILGMGLDPRIGTTHLQPGLGYGGPCLPKDARALEFLAKSKSCDFKLLRTAIEVNARQSSLVVNKLKQLLGSLKGKEIALLGLAFKPGTDDVAEAPAIDMALLLIAEDAKPRLYDPMAIENARSLLPAGEVFYNDIYSAATGACAIILATEWPEIIQADWNRIKEVMIQPYIVMDGRNALPREKLIDAGFKYRGVGR